MTEEVKEVKLWSNLRALVDSYFSAQKSRIGWGNRLDAVKRGADVQEDPKLLQAQFYHDQFLAIEEKAFDEIETELGTYKVWPWLKRVKGIGPTLAGKLLSEIDIRRASHVSSLWAFCGLGLRKTEDSKASIVNLAPMGEVGEFPDGGSMEVESAEFIDGVYHFKVDGETIEMSEGEVTSVTPKEPGVWQIQKLRKGVKIDYSPRLKSTCFLIGTSFLRCGSPYRRVYDSAKEFYKAKHPEWTLKHQDMAARRKMVKIFLSHLWVKYREAEGLPVTKPYAIERLGHDSYIAPEEFVKEDYPAGT